jgi:hydroxymethylglutaryl-CoA synthase
VSGIVSYGVHLPYWRLQRAAIGQALGLPPGRGTRSVASYDEDATSMGVEAARRALAAAPDGYAPHGLWFATTEPPYLDKTNATAIHAALDLPSWAGAFDVIGGVRSGVGAAIAAGSGSQMAVLSDLRTGLPGGADESNGGDAAVALCFGDVEPIAVTIGGGTAVREFTDRWRRPGDVSSKQWEERFGEHAYLPLAEEAVAAALKGAGLAPGEVRHLVVAGLHGRAVKAVPRACGLDPATLAPDLTDVVGNPGAAQWALVLADVLDRAGPDEVIAVVILADGVNVWLVRTTDALAAFRARQRDTVQAQIERSRDDLTYQQFLTWRGLLVREPPRRPEPDRPAAPPSLRTEDWKFGLVGRRTADGFVTLPPARVSVSGTVDAPGERVRMADVPATIATFTVDRLAYSLSPPVVAAIIDFDGGGRFPCELTDVDPATVAIGDRVEMTFRRLYTVDGIHDYFWKARPLPRG